MTLRAPAGSEGHCQRGDARPPARLEQNSIGDRCSDGPTLRDIACARLVGATAPGLLKCFHEMTLFSAQQSLTQCRRIGEHVSDKCLWNGMKPCEVSDHLGAVASSLPNRGWLGCSRCRFTANDTIFAECMPERKATCQSLSTPLPQMLSSSNSGVTLAPRPSWYETRPTRSRRR